MSLLFGGCGQTPRENKIEIRPDNIIVSNPDTTYYTKTEDGTLYSSSDAIVVCGYNKYKCINTSIEYDEESGKYICVVEFKKIIE